jgi:hypothetical protein
LDLVGQIIHRAKDAPVVRAGDHNLRHA